MRYMNMRMRNNFGSRFSVLGSRLADRVFCPKPKTQNPKPSKAFTLVELLIVSALLAIISMAVYAVFNSGVKIWQRIGNLTWEEDLNILLDKLQSDLRNSFDFQGIDFIGEKDKLVFATIVDSARLKKKTIGQVAYFFNPYLGTLSREERDYAHIFGEDRGRVSVVSTNIRFLRFQYRYYDEEMKRYIWNYRWMTEGLPDAVRVELEFDDGDAARITRTVDIPSAGSI